jgi:hypothetical protein
MKQEQNNDIDLLLRSLGRTARADFESVGPGEEHLDADELNAYAEKALPQAAHARYTKHIADCSRCRSIVSELSVAAGVVVEEKRKEPVVVPTGLKAFLANLFSPMVIRYVVPALALLIVGWVGFVVFRQSQTDRFSNLKPVEVAQKQVGDQQTNPRAGLTNEVTRDSVTSDKPVETKPEASKADKAGADGPREVKDAKSAQPVTSTDQVAAAPGSANSTTAAEPPPAPKPTPVAQETAGRRADTVVVAPEVATAKSNEKQAEKESKASQPSAVGGFAIGNPGKAKAEARGRGDAAPRDEETMKRRQADDKDVSETRSVGGRRFRKEGSVWIDVAYSSQATTNVSRGSEQYRALIADEPGIKTIADQLDGEVIILWKSRAYRIK